MRTLRTLCILATLALAALFIAQGTGYWIAARLAGGTTAARRPRDTPVHEAVGAERSAWTDAREILARNMFDSATGPLWPPPRPASPTADLPEEPRPVVVPRCDTETRIAAAFHNRWRPERSWVVLRGPGAGPGWSYSTGMRVDKWTVEQIEPEGVRLAAPDGEACWLGMFNANSRAKIERELAVQATKSRRTAAHDARQRRRADSRPPFSANELEAGVRPLGARRYMVRRHVLDKARAYAASIAESTRVAPARGRARGQGLRLTRLRAAGLIAHLGLQRGDILQNVNGVPAKDTAALLAAYATLDRGNRITLAVLRNREQLRFEYFIQ